MMRTIKSRILCLMMLCFALHDAMAQSGRIFDTGDQLSSSFVTQIMEDNNGFIWVGTRNGLNVYDGYDFTTFTKDKKDNQGFNNNYVNCLGTDRMGHIFVGTNNGVMMYHGAKFNSLKMIRDGKEVKCYVRHILTRKDGTVWICTSGYGIMQIDKSFTKCTSIGGALKKFGHVSTAKEDHLGRVWFITEDSQLFQLGKNGKVTGNIPGTAQLKAMDLTEDRQGNIFLATEQQGVFIMRAGQNAFSRIEAINLTSIEKLYVTRNNLLYVCSNGHGVISYDIKTGKVNNSPFLSYQTDLSKAKVTSILEDRQGNIWFTMLQKGVFMQPHKSYDFGYMGYRFGAHNQIGDNCVTSVLLGHDGKIWVGTDKDNLYSLAGGIPSVPTHFTNAPSTILSLCEDKWGNVWIGSYREGVGYIDPVGNYHKVDLKVGSDISVFDIKCDPLGNLWFASMGEGLICLRADRTIKQYVTTQNADRNLKANGLPNNYLAKLAFSKDYSKLFVATSVGLSCLDLKKNSWVSAFGKNCLNKGSFSHCVQTDRQGRVWYGTEDGIFVYNLKDVSHPLHYTVENGLSSNEIAFITEDAQGKMWVGTIHGLNSITPKTGDIRIFYTGSGLQSNEFSDGAVSANANGTRILIGGTGGINWFNPLTMKQHKGKLDVFISSFMVNNTVVHAGRKSGFYTITEKPSYFSNLFQLSHDDSSFSLQLTTLTYNNIEQISYAYSINGDQWHQMQPGQNDLSFYHMPAGTYHIQVKAVSNSLESSIREFTVIVHPVWYASIWAKMGYLLILLGLGVLYIKHRKRKEEDRMLLQKHIHAEEMGEAKLKFFMNISHEIRTPLTLIITPLLSLIKEDKDSHRQGIYDMIRKNSERILHLINQMMDLRKIDKGQMAMHMSETDMVAFINDEYKLFKQQAQAKNIHFSFEHADESLPVWIDRDNFDKVLMNVLSNAFKFTPAGGKVRITLSHSPHHARIAIKDNGKGIDDDKLETIFQRFYQSPTQATDRNVGTGIGLDLTRSLVELHYGTIKAANNRSLDDPSWISGSEFLITLPLGNAHLKPEEILESMPETQTDEDIQLFNEDESVEDAPETLEDELTQAKGSNAKKSTLAIVEDDEAILEYLNTQLQDMFHILSYHNGKEALPEITRLQPDLVISDIMMPEMDGNTLCTKLKSNVSTNHIPVILLTAMSREEDQITGLQTGADAYIVKPFNMDILRRTIINLLNVRRTLRNKFSGSESQQDKIKDVEMVSANDQLMNQVMAVINENISNEDLSIDMIAKEVGISRVHLHRKMKELTNQTPHSFIRNMRLQQAAKLLRESKQSVSEVMYSCGFSNPASFSTMFKNLYGTSPRDYMNGTK